MTQTHVTVESFTLSYYEKKLFDDFSCEFPAKQITAVLGKSGIGKTSLLRHIAGFHRHPHESRKLNPCHSREGGNPGHTISYLPQKPTLLPWLNIEKNMLISKKLQQQKITAQDKQNAQSLLEQVQLAHVANLYPHELSGGMYQRVALARLLFEDKSIVLLDEPFSALDAITRLDLQDLTVKLFKNKTVLLVTHDPLEALRIANQVFILSGQPARLSNPIIPDSSNIYHQQKILIDELRDQHD